MTILSYDICNGESYAVLKHDRTDETYPSTQFYSFPYTEKNRNCLRQTLGANSGALIIEPLADYKTHDIHTLSVFTFTNKKRDTVTTALALDRQGNQISLKQSLDAIFPLVIYDIFKTITLDRLTKDNVLNYKNQTPYTSILNDYEKPSEYGIGLYIDGQELEKGEHLVFSGFKTFMPDKPDVIEVSVNENGVLYGIIAGIEHIKPDGSKLTDMDSASQKENLSKAEWLANAIAEETRDAEITYQKRIDTLKRQFELNDLEQNDDFNRAVKKQTRVKNERLTRAIESLRELDNEVFIAYISKGQLDTLINTLTLTKRWKPNR